MAAPLTLLTCTAGCLLRYQQQIMFRDNELFDRKFHNFFLKICPVMPIFFGKFGGELVDGMIWAIQYFISSIFKN